MSALLGALNFLPSEKRMSIAVVRKLAGNDKVLKAIGEDVFGARSAYTQCGVALGIVGISEVAGTIFLDVCKAILTVERVDECVAAHCCLTQIIQRIKAISLVA
jgi:hypothetical protein